MTSTRIVLSADPANPIQPVYSCFLTAGYWRVQPVAGDTVEYSAWNAWSGAVVDCPTPSSCSKGWLNKFRVYYWIANSEAGVLMTGGTNGRYQTPELALESATAVNIELKQDSLVAIYIGGDYRDDKGGLTLELTKLN